MPIPFPKVHIAQSAINRILNAIDGEPSFALTDMQPPIPPDPTVEGASLDNTLTQPVAGADVPPEEQPAVNQGMVENSALGGSPFDGAVIGAAGAEAPAGGMFG